MYQRLLLLIIIVCLPFCSFSQSMGTAIPEVKLANVDSFYTDFSTILANPRLTTGMVNCQVNEFTISFTVKDGATYGPYPTSGFMLTDEQKIVLKNLRNEKVKILVEHINMRCDEQDAQPRNVIVYFGYGRP